MAERPTGAAQAPRHRLISVGRETPDQPDVQTLLDLADARSRSLYPAESRHGSPLAELLALDVRFFVVRRDGVVVGCGGYAVGPDGYGEVKRIFLAPEARGAGLGRRLLQAIEAAAEAEHLAGLRLETGIRSVEAIGLYRRLGYAEREPFGGYAADPSSQFMEKSFARRAEGGG